jgi:ArsR family transcriptional regulator
MPSTTALPRLHTARAVRLFHALSDETRLAALALLRGGERCVCELQVALRAQQSRLSFHLRVLRDAGLVTDRREGRWSYYAVVPDALREAHDLVRTLATEPAETTRASTERRSPRLATTHPAPRNATRAAASRRLRVFGDCCT